MAHLPLGGGLALLHGSSPHCWCVSEHSDCLGEHGCRKLFSGVFWWCFAAPDGLSGGTGRQQGVRAGRKNRFALKLAALLQTQNELRSAPRQTGEREIYNRLVAAIEQESGGNRTAAGGTTQRTAGSLAGCTCDAGYAPLLICKFDGELYFPF